MIKTISLLVTLVIAIMTLAACDTNDQTQGPVGTPIVGPTAEVMPAQEESTLPVTLPPVEIPAATPEAMADRTPVEPYAGAPKCDESLHDDTTWHSLWNEDHGCHYTHTHNGNPHELDYIFGPAGEPYGGLSLSYPWQTWMGADLGHEPHDGMYENEMKHAGYKWEARDIGECIHEVNQTHLGNDYCVTAWRVQYHWAGGVMDALTRIHSYWAEMQVCTPDLSQCGIIKTGGWGDFGVLHVPYKVQHIPLPNDPPEFNGNLNPPPYRGHREIQRTPGRRQGYNTVPVVWNMSGRYGYNQLVEFDIFSLDDWQGIDPDDPARVELLCPDYQCEFNHSTALIYELVVHLRHVQHLDKEGDGLVTYRGYTDRYGNIVDDCSPLGVDCIPLVIENLPVDNRRASARIEQNNYDNVINYDLSPPEVYWIEYPN